MKYHVEEPTHNKKTSALPSWYRVADANGATLAYVVGKEAADILAEAMTD